MSNWAGLGEWRDLKGEGTYPSSSAVGRADPLHLDVGLRFVAQYLFGNAKESESSGMEVA
jgi:hypothetical protein